MKKVLVVTLAVATLAALVGIASAHGPMGWGMRGAGFGPGGGGPGFGCGGFGAAGGGPAGAGPAAQITPDKAKELAEGYTKQYLAGYTVERVLPIQRRFATMYQAELKGPAGEQRVLHVNPWGNVMPFGGPVAR